MRRFNADFQAGDIVLFTGEGWISQGIRWRDVPSWILGQRTYSHVGVICDCGGEDVRAANARGELLLPPGRGGPVFHQNRRPLLFESTMLFDQPCEITGEKIGGVQSHDPWPRCWEYEGSSYVLRLSDWYTLTPQQSELLTARALSMIGRGYDFAGAARCGMRVARKLWWRTQADLTTLFCSEFVWSLLMSLNLLPKKNPALCSPGGTYRGARGCCVYQPIRQIYQDEVAA